MATRRKMKRNDYSRTKIKVLAEGKKNPRQPGSFAEARYDVLLRMSKGGKVMPVASDVFEAKAKKPYRPVDLLKDIAFKRVALVPMKGKAA
jgi:hypothetical protein